MVCPSQRTVSVHFFSTQNTDSYQLFQLFNEVAALTKEDTVPQIFVDETFIGGYPELKMLYERRHIHELLRPKPAKVEVSSKFVTIATLEKGASFFTLREWV